MQANGLLEVILQAEYCMHSTTVWRTGDWDMAPISTQIQILSSGIPVMGIEEASSGMDSRQEPGAVPDSGSAPEPGICLLMFASFF